jgi:hypothetical protein
MRTTTKDRIKRSIKASKSKVFLRADFEKFGAYDQVGRALKGLIADGVLVKNGYGVYVVAEKSILSGKPIPTIFLTEVGLQVCKKLGIKAELGYFQRKYQSGESTQIPMKDVISIDRPMTRKITWNKRELLYEKNR